LTDWTDREQYGNALREIINDLKAEYDDTERSGKAKLGHAIAYLIQVQSSLITAEQEVEKRITKLEQLAGISKKNVIRN